MNWKCISKNHVLLLHWRARCLWRNMLQYGTMGWEVQSVDAFVYRKLHVWQSSYGDKLSLSLPRWRLWNQNQDYRLAHCHSLQQNDFPTMLRMFLSSTQISFLLPDDEKALDWQQDESSELHGRQRTKYSKNHVWNDTVIVDRTSFQKNSLSEQYGLSGTDTSRNTIRE